MASRWGALTRTASAGSRVSTRRLRRAQPITATTGRSCASGRYSEHGTLTKVTDRNNGAITVTQHDGNGEHKGFKLTETRSGRWVDLRKTNASQWQAKDHTGRTAVFDLNTRRVAVRPAVQGRDRIAHRGSPLRLQTVAMGLPGGIRGIYDASIDAAMTRG